ncbi:hypothetical protein PSHT_11866 [Puccinia striiformis]|uniref:Uncharacterized protein n=1 Tax=Puccinia striiformis TaxID=27350 RepID=A0A2S4V0G8_9BASI|nr:hypothetical protein PSHT_11866 [Puccinia striiformis]
MVNFDATTSLPIDALGEYIVIGLPTHLRGKANEWELLEADPFDYPHFEKRLTLFDQIIKEQSSNQPSRTAPSSQPTNCSPDEVDAFLDLQGICQQPTSTYKQVPSAIFTPNPAGRPTQPPAGRPPHWAATITAVDKHPATDVDSEETESFPPPSFESDDTHLSVISVQEADSVGAGQLAKDNRLAPEFCTGDLAHSVSAIKEDL